MKSHVSIFRPLVALLVVLTAAPIFSVTARAAVGNGGGAAALGKFSPEALAETLGKEDLFNEVVKPLLQKVLESPDGKELTIPEFLKDLHIAPKFFHAEGSDSDGVLGFEYHYKKSVANRVIDEAGSNHPMGLSWTLESKGSVAADAKKNPHNLLESGGTLHVFQGIGGVSPRAKTSEESKAARQKALMEAGQDPEFLLQRGPTYEKYAAEMIEHLQPQFFWDLQAHATLESDQQFRKKQWAYGGKLSLVGRDWRRDSPLGWANVLDYPFAATRWLFNGEDFQPSACTLPSLVVGLDQVDPSKDEDRLKIDPNKSRFDRWRAEVAFKTRIMSWNGQKLFVRAAYRRFHERNASGAIENANRDDFEYVVVKVDLPGKFFVSYSHGKLPFDLKSQAVYALGWALHE